MTALLLLTIWSTSMAGIYINSDAWCLWLVNEPVETYTKEEIEDLIRRDVDFYAQPGVDAVFFNMNFQRTFFPSKVWTPYWKDCSLGEDGKLLLRGKPIPCKEGEESPEPVYRNMYLRSKRINELVPNFMRLRYDYCKEKGIKCFNSMRMNDTHHSALGQEWRPQHSDLWLDHKEYLRAWYRHTWRSEWNDNNFDYGEKYVYDYHLALVREYFLDYESDGIELDFLRNLPLFRPGFDEANKDLLTGFLRDVKKIALEAEEKWGHKMEIAVRIPGKVNEAYSCGMEVHTWAKEGLIDIILPSCKDTSTEQDLEISLWRIIAPKPVIIAGEINYNAMTRYGATIILDPAADAGFASNFYQQGADSIYLYNHFFCHEKKYPFLRELFTQLSSRKTVSEKSRRHIVTHHSPIGEGNYYRYVVPQWIWSGCCNGGIRVNCGEGNGKREAYAVIGFSRPVKIDILLNAKRCEESPLPEELALPKAKKYDIHYVCAKIPPQLLHDGWNNIEIFNKDTAPDAKTILADEICWIEVFIK